MVLMDHDMLIYHHSKGSQNIFPKKDLPLLFIIYYLVW